MPHPLSHKCPIPISQLCLTSHLCVCKVFTWWTSMCQPVLVLPHSTHHFAHACCTRILCMHDGMLAYVYACWHSTSIHLWFSCLCHVGILCLHVGMFCMHEAYCTCMLAYCACMLACCTCMLHVGILCLHVGILWLHIGILWLHVGIVWVHVGILCMDVGMVCPMNAMLCMLNLTLFTPIENKHM